MKKIKVILAIAAALIISAPAHTVCAQTSAASLLTKLTAANGNSVGAALVSLYTQYKTDKKIDFTTPTNINNLLVIAQNIKGLATAKDTKSFLTGLISGSNNLVNVGNSASVLSSLSSLSNIDMSALAKNAAGSAATSAASSLISKLGSGSAETKTSSATDAVLAQAAPILTDLFGKFKQPEEK